MNSSLSSMEDTGFATTPFLASALAQAESVALRLRAFSLYVFFLTLISVILVVFGPVERHFVKALFFVLPILTSVAAMALLAVRDHIRRQGDALFEEITDELHWDVRREYYSQSPGGDASARPDLKVRLVLRRYAQSTDMPLVPGSLGATVYASLNLGCIVGAVALVQPFFWG